MNDVHVLTTYPEVYSEEKMTDVFPEARLHFTSGSATAPVDFSIENGKSYIVYFDYVDYKIDAANGSIANNLFSISVSDGTMTVSASDGYHTVGVTACETTYNKLPAAYYEDGGVSSWNDLTDKPFGEETTVKEVLAECQPVYSEDMDGMSIFTEEREIDLTVGAEYIVNWNGVDYVCVAKETADGDVYLGNGMAFTGDDSGEPFMVAVVPSIGLQFIDFDGSTTLTISIRQETKTIKTIDPKYIVLTSPKGTKYNLSVSDDGTLSAVAQT